MNNQFDFESKKFSIILFLLFLFFALLILKAFDFIPKDEANKLLEQTQVMENNDVQTEDEKQGEQETNKKGLNIDLSGDVNVVEKTRTQEEIPTIDETEKLEPISPLSENSVKSNEEQQDIFYNAKKFKDNKQYTSAVEEYKTILAESSDIKIKAQCYEEISKIYAIVKRYGSALSYAQKAYNTYPTSEREMLLARLYYKTGDLDSATKRMNNVLQRDFSFDR